MWGSETVWKLWRSEKYLALTSTGNMDCSVHRLVTTLITLLWLTSNGNCVNVTTSNYSYINQVLNNDVTFCVQLSQHVLQYVKVVLCLTRETKHTNAIPSLLKSN